MTELVPVNVFSPVPQLETNTLALGGTGNPMNHQAQALLNRTEYLNNLISEIQVEIDGLSSSFDGLSLPAAADTIGFERSELSAAVSTVGSMLSAQWRNVWEFASLIVSKPNPSDPSTWDWTPAAQAVLDSGAGVAYFPPITGGVYKTSAPIIADSNIRIIGQQAKRLGAQVGTRIENIGSGDTVIYSNTKVIYDAGIENIGITSTTGHAVNLKFGATRCRFFQMYPYTKATNKSCVAALYNVGTPGVDWVGSYSNIFEGGEYIVDPVARTAPNFDVITTGTFFNENTFRNMWFTNATGRPAVRLFCTAAGSLLTNNTFDGVTFEVCRGGLIWYQAASHLRITGCSAWDTPSGYDGSLIQCTNDNTVMQTRGTLIENFARIGNAMNGSAVEIDLGFSMDTTIINHATVSGAKIEFRSRSAVVIGAVNATVTNDGAVCYITGSSMSVIAIAIRGALAHTGSTAGFFGKTPVAQPAARANTTGATLAQLETEVNYLKQVVRDLGLMAT